MKTLLQFALLLLLACGTKQTKQKVTTESGGPLPAVVSALTLPDPNPAIPEIPVKEFTEYKVKAVILPGTYRVFHKTNKASGQMTFEEVTPVDVVEKSDVMYSLTDTTILCDGAYFLKISYNSQPYVFFGRDVYEIAVESKFSVEDGAESSYEIFAATPFKIGASTEEGLTGCDDYSMIVIRRKKDDRYSLIQDPLNSPYGNNPITKGYMKLVHDDGMGESINSVTFKNDSIRLDISVVYQMGTGSYRIQIAYDELMPKASIYEQKKSLD